MFLTAYMALAAIGLEIQQMYYKPEELKLVSIKNAPVGSVCEYQAHNGFDKFIRLSDLDGKTRILLLNGEYAFLPVVCSHDEDLARVLCGTSDVLVKLGTPSEDVDHRVSGLITVVEGGAFIVGARSKMSHSFDIPNLSMTTWSEHDGSKHPSLRYPEWELGYLDGKGDFQLVFSKKK